MPRVRIGHLFSVTAVTLLITAVYWYIIRSANHTTIALTYLLVPLVAGTYGFVPGVLASILCAFAFNFFFLPPVGTLSVHDPENLLALIVFLITALTANRLSSNARRRSEDSDRRGKEVSRLLEVSRAILSMPDPETAGSLLATRVAEIFTMRGCILSSLDERNRWTTISATQEAPAPPPDDTLTRIHASGVTIQLHSDAGNMICVPLKATTKTTGVLTCFGDNIEPATLEALAGLVALALERVRFLKQLSEAETVKQSDQLKSAILASVSHDLRTPLTSIVAAVDNLLSTDVEWNEASRHEFYTIIKEEVDRLSRVVQNLLEMARIETGECRPVKEWGAVPELLADVLNRCGESLARHQVRLDIQDRLPLVSWDERLVGQALSNLLENAGRYSPAGTEIVLGVALSDHELQIRVQDQGPGIPSEELPRVFDRFFRGRSAGKDRSGTGMGLSIARGIMEAHGGSLRVESPAGQGAVFTMVLPVETRSP